jgi:DNA-binding NarL/FixJ family response regulator
MARKKGTRKTKQSAPPTKSKLRVLLVDDSKVFLDLEERWLSQDARIEIVGRATSGEEAIEHVQRLAPDLVVMDVTMQDMTGLQAAERIKAQGGVARIVLLTVEISEEFKQSAQALGVDGYLAKAQLSTKLLPLLLDLLTG